MEIFIGVKKHFASLGIQPDTKSRFNTKNLMIMSQFVYCFIAMSAFFLFKSESMIDFGNSFYGAACVAVHISSFSSNILERNEIFELINRFEDTIKERKFYTSLVLCYLWRNSVH